MKNLICLGIAIALGVGAAGVNAAWLKTQKRPPVYVAARINLKRGDIITSQNLVAVPVPGNAKRISKSLIPWKSRSLLYGTRAPRSYRANDVFFYRDIKLPTTKSKWEVLGPFRIVGVGSRFKDPSLKGKGGGGGNNVTIAINPDFDERTRRLLEVMDPNRRGSGPRIVAVQVVPKTERELTEQALLDIESEHYVHQTISLSGIENIPAVLYNGEVIRFVLPAPSRY